MARGLVLFLLFVGCNGCDDLGAPVHVDCGNGVVDGLEVCDGAALGGKTCVSEGFENGTLTCARSCGGFIVAGCGGVRGDLDVCSLCSYWEDCVRDRCVDTCDGEPFDEDTSLEFDITVVQVTGAVTVDSLPTGSVLRFVGEVYWEPAVVPIADDGSFQVALEPATYEVTWQPGPGFPGASERLRDLEVGNEDLRYDVSLTPWSTFQPAVVTDFPGDLGELVVEHLDPRFGRVEVPLAAPELQLRDGEYRIWWARPDDDSGSALEFLETITAADLRARGSIELPVIETSLTVTMNGAILESGSGVRAEIIRRDDLPRPGWLSVGKDRETWELDAAGHATGWMLDQPRDVALVINGPPVWGWIWAKRDVTPAAEIEIDVEAPRLAGEVKRNGGRLPNSAQEAVSRGRLEFTSDQGFVSIELSDRGRAEFALRLPRGVWDLTVSGIVFAGVLPVVPWIVPDPISLQSDTDDHLIDVPAVLLAGQLTVNGDRPPDEAELDTRGSLELRTEGSNTWFSIPIAARGPASWEVIVTPGVYDAELVRWWFATNGEPAPDGVLPLGSWPLGEFDVPVSTAYDVDVRLQDVTVEMREHGEPARPGLLWFTHMPEQRLSRQIDTADEPVTVSLYPGYYRVMWAPYNDGQATDPVVVETALVVNGAVERSYDVGAIELTGSVRVNGMPAIDAGELGVQLTRHPSANSTLAVDVEPVGPASFRADIVNGYYTIVLGAADDHATLPDHGVVLQQACSDARLD